MAHVVLARPTKACASSSGGTLRSMRHQKYSFDPLNLNTCPRMGTAKAPQKTRGTCGTCRAQSSPQVEPPEGDSRNAAQQEDSVALPDNFCIIESRESVKNFANMQMEELEENIQSRRNKIFLLMEEVRRLRVQQRMRSDPINSVEDESVNRESYPSFIPFFPPVNEETLKLYTNVYGLAVLGIILFGGLVAPSLEVKLGLGGRSYREFINLMHLPQQLAEVDPIVASFCGGAVGVLTSLLIVEKNNSKLQAKQKCIYCKGTGYLPCGNCMGSGVSRDEKQGTSSTCSFCSGSGKVMCTACLCTGKQLATEHDPRVDPFTLSD